jgi:predicted XRE-type DNA-binding protein
VQQPLRHRRAQGKARELYRAPSLICVKMHEMPMQQLLYAKKRINPYSSRLPPIATAKAHPKICVCCYYLNRKCFFMTTDAYFRKEPLDNLPAVGRQFRALRKAAGKTQVEVASAVGMRQEALSRFESGAGNDFSAAKLLRLLRVLGHEVQFTPLVRRPTLDEVLSEVKSGTNTGPSAR